MSFNTAGNWNQSPDNLVVNVSTAYLDANQEKDFSAGVNASYLIPNSQFPIPNSQFPM